jgi:hypothetical protein
MVAIRGHFDGKVFIPDEPVDLPRDRALIFHVEVMAEPDANNGTGNLWDTLNKFAGSIQAPSDWSLEHDHYLYGTPKRTSKADEK